MIAAQEKMKKTLEQWIPIILPPGAGRLPANCLHWRDTSRWHGKHGPPKAGQSWKVMCRVFYRSAITITPYRREGQTAVQCRLKLADCWEANIGPGKKAGMMAPGNGAALVHWSLLIRFMEGHAGEIVISVLPSSCSDTGQAQRV